MTPSPLGDAAVVIGLGERVDLAAAQRVRAVAAEIERHRPLGVVDVVAAFASVAVYFDPAAVPSAEALGAELETLVARADAGAAPPEARVVEVPVQYGGEPGPDLDEVAAQHGLTAAEVVAQHAGAEYVVHAIGFAPGFPYLGGLPPTLATPRRATPRPRVPAGSVGIGGAQTGVYPLVSPGGWHLIGRTPLRLFDATRGEPSLLAAGDRVKFRAIEAGEYAALVAGEAPRAAAPAAAGRGLQIVRAGMFTTVQDGGRRGYRGIGVPLSGAADPFALRLANLLVGNPEHAAGLEFTMVGPEIVFLHDTVAVLGGGDFGGPARWRPFAVAAGTRLELGPARSGCRGYLAVAGGIDVAPVLGSRSTYVRASLGGHEGRPLQNGDLLPVPAVQRRLRDHWWIDERILPAYSGAPTVRVVPAAQAGEFAETWTERTFTVAAQSDRMGVRLSGEPLVRRVDRELVSSPVVPGTIQVPPDGQPIVLLADAQTIGGYPQLAHVISVDLPLMAQVKPGDRVRFRLVTFAEAQQLIATQERAIGLLREGLAQKLA